MTSPTFAAIAFSGSLRNGSSNTAPARQRKNRVKLSLTVNVPSKSNATMA